MQEWGARDVCAAGVGGGNSRKGQLSARAPGQPRQQASLLEWNPYSPTIEWELETVGKGEQVKSWRLDRLRFLNHKSKDSKEHSGNSVLQAESN